DWPRWMTVQRQNPAYRRTRMRGRRPRTGASFATRPGPRSTAVGFHLDIMCGRSSITGDLGFYAEYFAVDEVVTETLEKSWNVAPTDPIYVVNERDGARNLGSMRWGLVPHWATDPKAIHINARAETVATNRTFSESFA